MQFISKFKSIIIYLRNSIIMVDFVSISNFIPQKFTGLNNISHTHTHFWNSVLIWTLISTNLILIKALVNTLATFCYDVIPISCTTPFCTFGLMKFYINIWSFDTELIFKALSISQYTVTCLNALITDFCIVTDSAIYSTLQVIKLIICYLLLFHNIKKLSDDSSKT